jgi:quinol monooxygenase YgiN
MCLGFAGARASSIAYVAAGHPGAVTLRPLFRMQKEANAQDVREYLTKFVQRVRDGVASGKETGCMHYDFVMNDEAGTVQCREMYTDAAAVVAHVGNVGDLFPGLFSLQVEMELFEVLGPKDQLDNAELQEALAALNPQYFYQV